MGTPKAVMLEQLTAFAKEVMPHLRPLFAEYEDRYWPKALPSEDRVAPGTQSDAARQIAERTAAA